MDTETAFSRGLTLKEGAHRVKKSPDTLKRWAKRWGVGRQIGPYQHWRFDPLGLAACAAGDADALDAFRRGDMADPALAKYREGRAA